MLSGVDAGNNVGEGGYEKIRIDLYYRHSFQH